MMGDSNDFNARYAIDEVRFWDFLEKTQKEELEKLQRSSDWKLKILAFGLALMAMVYSIGHLSGCHINPAVTIALWAVRRFPAKDVLVYVPSQCLGAVAASLVLWGIFTDTANLGATTPSLGLSEAFAVEWILAFALMFVIAAVASDERVAYGFGGIAVGFTLVFDVLFGLTLTGASVNPARSLGPAVAAGVWEAHWLYWLAPIFGMIAAAWTYETLRAARSPDLQHRRTALFGVGAVNAGVEGSRRVRTLRLAHPCILDWCSRREWTRGEVGKLSAP